MSTTRDEEIRELVRARYAAAAQAAGGCCSPAGDGCSAPTAEAGFGAALYDEGQLGEVPATAARVSLGCGNPTMLARLEPGEVVLDLGSGGGLDVVLSARRVGPSGRAYGLDMTPEMVELARRNLREAGIDNAEILEGTLEAIPLPDESVDVVISNCVINLSPDKARALREAARVLRPGGRFAVSDVVLTRPLPPQVQRIAELWAGCVAGALEEGEYRRLLEEAGFTDVEVVPTLVHDRESIRGFVEGFDEIAAEDLEAVLDEVDGAAMNAFVRARRR